MNKFVPIVALAMVCLVAGAPTISDSASKLLGALQNVNKCDDQLVATVVEAHEAGLKLADHPELEGAVKSCSSYIVQAAEDRVINGTDSELLEFAQTLAPSMQTWPFFQGHMSKEHDISALALFVKQLSPEGRLEALFDGCQEWTSAVGPLFEGAKAIEAIEAGSGIFEQEQSSEFAALNYTNNVCQFAYKMDGDDKEALMSQI